MNDDKCTATKNPFVCECDGIPADPASYQPSN
jgi:hypothetical protein